MVLTKDEILNLTNNTKTITIENIGEIKIRQLTNKEINEIKSIQSQAIGIITQQKTTEGIIETRDINATENIKYNNMARIKSITYSLSVDETWTEKEVNSLPQKVLEPLYAAIIEYNNLKD